MMDYRFTSFAALLLMLWCVSDTEAQGYDTGGYRLQRDASYFIVAPQKVRPNEVYQMSVSVLQMYTKGLDVRAVIRRERTEIASEVRTFNLPGTQMLQLKVPENAEEGNYTLRVEGITADSMTSGYIFENETRLTYDAKQVSVFIQTNKGMYMQGQTVHFRLMPVEPNLMSRSGSMDVYIVDSSGTTVRRWLSMQTNAGGVLDMSFLLSEQPRYGTWKIRAKAWGYWYERTFEVLEFWITMLDVNVTLPFHIMDDEYGLGGLVVTNLTLGQPARGTIKVKAEVRIPLQDRDPNVTYEWPTVTRDVRHYGGTTDFMFTLDELRKVTPDKSIAYKEIYVEAEVFDWVVDMTATGFGICVVYPSQIDLILLGDSSRTFKPNQTMNIYYAAVNKDGSRMERMRKQVTVSGTERLRSGQTLSFEYKFLIGDDGIGSFSYTPGPNAEYVQMTALYDDSNTGVDLTAMRYYSPTDSYIYVTSSTLHPHVDQYMVFTVNTNTLVEQIYYIIVAAGNIITGGTLQMQSRQKTFSLALSRDMIPQAHILVWHIYQDEVISDSMNFYVNGTRMNKVSMKFNRGKDLSGDTIELNCKADPSSYVGYGGLEHELFAYGWHNFITEPDIIKELSTYDSLANTSFTYEWHLDEEQQELVFFPSPTYGIDSNTTFEYTGLIVFTDANVTRIPNDCNETIGWYPCMDGSCYYYDQYCDGVKQCQDGQDEMGCKTTTIVDPFTPTRERLHLLGRHFYQTSEWIWGGHFVKPDGRLDVRLHPTDEALPWVLSGFGISRDQGFGIINDYPRHQATRPFFMRSEVPAEIVKGEQIAVKLAIFNFWKDDIEAIITLHGSPDYKFVVVEDFGRVSSYNPRLKSGDIQTMIYLEKGAVTQIRFPVLPTVMGCLQINVTAKAFLYTDHEYIHTCVKYDGVTNHLHTPYFIDLISSGSMVLPDLSVPVPERFIKPQEREHLYVPGSPVANLGIVGDVVGGGLVEPVTAENAVRKPYGAAEQNMYNFAFNLYNLKYLKATNQLTIPVLKNTLSLMNMHLQRQMGYINNDGSFSMFRDYQVPTPSTWLTAYCLRVLTDANEKDWEFDFFIEVDLLNKMMLWLCRQQDASTGAFIEKSPLYDRKLWFNGTDGQPIEYRMNNVSLTAYVVITLRKAVRITGNAEICKTVTEQKAQAYLEQRLSELNDTYSIAITTYALHLLGSTVKDQAYNMLESRKRLDSYVYWANKPIPPNEVKMIDTIPYYQPRKWFDNEAYAVEATSYGLLTYLLRNQWSTSLPIMKWLQTMRNSYYAQSSTQDSITALQALVEYAKLDTNRALYTIEFSIDITSNGNATQTVLLSKDNWSNMQKLPIYPVWGSVRGRVQGTGLALMQLTTDVNVEYPYQILPTSQGSFFEIDLLHMNFSGKNFSIMEITPCARWTRPDLSARSGLAVIEMHVPTGYVVTNDVLRSYVQSGIVPSLRRAEQFGRKMAFYFDYLESTARTCVSVRLDRWYPAANMTIQHLLRVFDYYEPGMHNTTLYNTWHLFNLHVCQVCASFQCPYCAYYNTSPHSSPLPSTILLLVTITLFIALRQFIK